MARTRFQPGAASDHYHDTLGVDEDRTGEQSLQLVNGDEAAGATIDADEVGVVYVEAHEEGWGSAELDVRASEAALRVKDATAASRAVVRATGGSQPTVVLQTVAADGNPQAGIQLVGTKIILSAVPTANPNEAGQIWNDGGTLKVSAG